MKIAALILALTSVALAAPKSTNSLIEVNPYIVNGTNANIRDYPWVVSVRSSGSHNCGGSILSPRYVLCAAHCFGDSIQYGASRISRQGENIINIQTWVDHEQYNGRTIENDVAVLTLVSNIPFGPTAGPVTLPRLRYEVPGNWETPANLVGWGYERSGGSVQNDLQEVRLAVASNAHCKDVHTSVVFDSNICAGVPGGYKGQCSGDSGGPLTLLDGTQVGIVSWSVKPCTVPPYPGVYTKVSHFRDWIETRTGLKFDGDHLIPQ